MKPSRIALRSLFLEAAPLLLFSALSLPRPAAAAAPESIRLLQVLPAAAPVRGAGGGEVATTAFDLDREGAASLRALGTGIVHLALPGRGDVALVLRQIEILDKRAVVTLTEAGVATPIPVDLTLFKGSIEGEPGAWAVLGVSSDMMVGSVTTAGGAWAVLPPGLLKGVEHHRILNESDLPAPLQDLTCGVEDDPAEWPQLSRAAKDALASPATNNIRYVCNVAVECDNDFYQLFGGSLGLATNYTLTLMATVSAIYERDINVTFNIPYLNFWGLVDDPYTQTDAPAQLAEFRDYWRASRTGVGRDVAILFSGRGYGGIAGIAYLNVLCNDDFGYALVSIINPNESYPTNQVNFNTSLVAHELGHNFASPHTHSCYWQSAGFVPPGALIDTCATAEGNCNSAQPHTAFGKGTIMSYCHLLGPASSTLRLDFHPACITVMRNAVEASCLQAAPVQPPTHLAIVDGPDGPALTWNASTTPGVTRYDVYASYYTFDHNPPLLDTTQVTQYAPLPSGTYYFKVKAIHPSGSSPFSAEVRASGCNYVGVGSPVNLPTQSVTADFDEDGIPDLAVVAQSGPKVVAILRGQGTGGVGNGTFAAPVTYAAGPAPTNLATADFNEDGILDLAVVSWAVTAGSAGTVQILLGQGSGGVGNGTFAPGGSYLTSKDPTHIVTGDFNEDGITDIASAGAYPGKVSIFLGQGSDGVGNGLFGTATHYLALYNRPRGLAVGDFNEDGIADLIVTYRGPSSDNEARVTVLEGQGTGGVGNGTFVEQFLYGIAASRTVNVFDLVSTDFNADGHLDVAVAADTQGTSGLIGRVGVALGNGDGTFGFGRSFEVGGTALNSMDVADWNQDGIADIMVTNNVSGDTTSVALLYGGGSAGVANGMLGVPLRFGSGGADGKKVLAGDFDEDDVPDAALSLSSSISMLKSLCAVSPQGELVLTAPGGGEAWAPGDNHAITWTKGTGVLTVDLQVSRDSGVTWETIARDLIGTSFDWTVTPPATVHARVRVQDSTLPNRSDASTTDFSIGPVSAVGDEGPADAAFRVSSVRPNPFQSSVALELTVPAAGRLSWAILDVQGRVVRREELVAGSAGPLQVTWDGRNDLGEAVPSGVYYARMTFAGRQVVRSVARVK